MRKTERNIFEDENYFTFPDEDETEAAQAACCGRCCKSCETPAAYAWRKRDIDISFLLEKAVNDELSDTERRMIEEYFYNGKKLVSIADEFGISPNAAKKSLDRAINKLREVLKYTIMYQHGICDENIVPSAVERAAVIAGMRHMKGETAGERLLILRRANNLIRKTVASAAGIEEARLGYFERDEKEITGSELLQLSRFYNVSTDYILKGERK